MVTQQKAIQSQPLVHASAVDCNEFWSTNLTSSSLHLSSSLSAVVGSSLYVSVSTFHQTGAGLTRVEMGVKKPHFLI